MKRFDFPSWLSRTPEELAQEAEAQAERRASFGRAKLTESERMIARGALLEETARGNLEAARKVKGAHARAQEKLELKNLAHALAMQGRFEEAIKHHPLKTMKKHYQGIIDAIEMPDAEKCPCPDTQHGEVSITPRFSRKEVYSQKHKKVVSIVCCGKCLHENARPLQSRLLISQAAINQSEAAGRTVLNDAQILGKG